RLAGWGGPNVRHGRNWFDERVFFAGDDVPSAASIGWIGRLEPSKDPLRAVEALAELQAAGGPVRAWFAGSGSLEDAVRESVERRGLAGSVELLGTIAPEQVADRLRETRALLVTSLWEGQPRSVLEALGCGTAVVSRAELNVADGWPLVTATRIASDVRVPERVAGVDLVERILAQEAVRLRVAILGGPPGAAAELARRVRATHDVVFVDELPKGT